VLVLRKTNAASNLIIDRNGKNIEGAASDLTVVTATATRLQYDATSGSWWTL
jgi:hypothetical protein